MLTDSLIRSLTDKIDKQVYQIRGIGQRPRFPMIILYAGEYAYSAKGEIDRTLRQVWRNRMDGIAHIKLTPEGFEAESPDASRNLIEMTTPAFQRKVDELCASETFRASDNLNLFMCTVLDTRDYSKIEEFQTAYECLNDRELPRLTGFPYCKTLGVVLLDESAGGMEFSGIVRQHLQSRLDEQTTMYQSVLILSNRLSNNALIRGEKNYALIGTIFLLINQIGDGFHSISTSVFPAQDHFHYLTASYSRKERPNRKIIEIMTHKVLEWITNNYMVGDRLSADQIRERLQFVDQHFTEWLRNLPPVSVMDGFPRKSAIADSLTGKSFISFDNETMSTFQTFYEKNVRTKILHVRDGMKESVKEAVWDSFTSGEMSQLNERDVENAINQMKVSSPEQNETVEQYYYDQARCDYYENVLPVYREALLSTREKVLQEAEIVKQLLKELNNELMIIEEDVNLTNYYEQLTVQYIERNTGDLSKILNSDGQMQNEKGFLEILGNILERILAEDQDGIFSCPLIGEMQIRMGRDRPSIRQNIRNELLENVQNTVRLRPTISRFTSEEMLQRIFVVDQGEEDFIGSLKNIEMGGIEVTVFDSGNTNAIEIVDLYRCNENMIV